MNSQDDVILIGLGLLAIVGLVYSATDFEIEPLFDVSSDRSSTGIFSTSERRSSTISTNRTSEREDEETPTLTEVRADVSIASVRETRNMTTREEELAHDRDRTFNGDEEREYVILRADRNNTIPVNVTGWMLTNRFETHEAYVGRARVTTGPNRTQEQDIFLSPGDELYIFSGEEPRGWFSAQINICHGYFNETFEDDLQRSISRQCPRIESENIPARFQNDEFCIDEFNEQRVCQRPRDVSSFISNACYNFIYDFFTYETCVEQNYTRDDFQTREWRYYLDVDDPLWNVRDDGLILYDTRGTIIDTRGID